jgi:hypothetical protein
MENKPEATGASFSQQPAKPAFPVAPSTSSLPSVTRPKGVPETIPYTITHSGKVVWRSPFYGFGRFVWAIYPDYWQHSWGRPPLFGYVSADDRFTAERVSYDVGLVHRNDTFKPRAVKSLPRRQESSQEGDE